MVEGFQFAKLHKNDDENFLKNIIFSDEPKFNTLGRDGKEGVWRKPVENIYQPNQHLLLNVKPSHGLRIHVFGSSLY